MSKKTVNENMVNGAEQPKWENMTVAEERGGKLLRLTANEGFILKSRNGHKRQEVLTDPKRAEGWQAVKA